jgi:hypothetical protein
MGRNTPVIVFLGLSLALHAPHANAEEHAEAAENPHANGAHNAHAGGDMFQVPEDASVPDPKLPVGTLEIRVVDPTEKPIAGATVTLGILNNSVAKGESRKRVTLTADANGIARATGLETGSTVAYRPMVIADGATFSAMPFRLPDESGMRSLLHVYPVIEDIASGLIVTQSMVYAEVKDDRIQVQEAFKVYNVGRSAWVPKDLVLKLPPEFTAFTSQQGMTDIGTDAVPKTGVRIRGTFAPGQHTVEFRWQLPYQGEADVHFEVGLPPRLASARVIAPASKNTVLSVPGFPQPESMNDGAGQRVLITEKQLRRDEAPLTSLSVMIGGLPTEGPGKIVATLLALVGLGIGVVLGMRRPERRDPSSERARLLDELSALERAKRAGEVGPKTYEAAHRELFDALTRSFAASAPTTLRSRRQRA